MNQSRIASHKRIHLQVGQYSTLVDSHRHYAENTLENVKQWSHTIGPYTEGVIDLIIEQHVEKQALRIISGFKNWKINTV